MGCPFAHDGFERQRADREVLSADLDGDVIPMILRHADVKAAARDWKTYSSDAPFRVPIPSEEDVRSVRQLPIESDPPEHTEYRKIVEPFFLRPREEAFVKRIERLIAQLLSNAAQMKSIEIVREFALPLQSRALTYLLNVPEAWAMRQSSLMSPRWNRKYGRSILGIVKVKCRCGTGARTVSVRNPRSP